VAWLAKPPVRDLFPALWLKIPKVSFFLGLNFMAAQKKILNIFLKKLSKNLLFWAF
jgi:hypothetical protein